MYSIHSTRQHQDNSNNNMLKHVTTCRPHHKNEWMQLKINFVFQFLQADSGASLVFIFPFAKKHRVLKRSDYSALFMLRRQYNVIKNMFRLVFRLLYLPKTQKKQRRRLLMSHKIPFFSMIINDSYYLKYQLLSFTL